MDTYYFINNIKLIQKDSYNLDTLTNHLLVVVHNLGHLEML